MTGDEAMTGPLRSYLDTLAREAGEELPADLIMPRRPSRLIGCSRRPGAATDGGPWTGRPERSGPVRGARWPGRRVLS